MAKIPTKPKEPHPLRKPDRNLFTIERDVFNCSYEIGSYSTEYINIEDLVLNGAKRLQIESDGYYIHVNSVEKTTEFDSVAFFNAQANYEKYLIKLEEYKEKLKAWGKHPEVIKRAEKDKAIRIAKLEKEIAKIKAT